MPFDKPVALPNPPVRGDENFQTDAQNFLLALPVFRDQQNALADQIWNAANLIAVTSTSTSSVEVGTGAKTFTVASGKGYLPGHVLQISSAANPDLWMKGAVTTYSGTTLTVDVTEVNGSGTAADWEIVIVTPQIHAAQAAAEAARDQAEMWADADEDVEVEAGQYSAKHHSIKAATSAASAAQDVYQRTGFGDKALLRTASDLNDTTMEAGAWWANDNTPNVPTVRGWCLHLVQEVTIRQLFYESRSWAARHKVAVWTRIYSEGYWSQWTRIDTPTGSVFIWPAGAQPAGYLKCNGAAISRTAYNNLFSILGISFGAGDGSTTFNLPDLRGEFIRGWDDGRGVDSGRGFGSWQGDTFKSHTHGFKVYGYTANNGSYAMSVSGDGGHIATPSTLSVGGSETRPRNVALLYCIKY